MSQLIKQRTDDATDVRRHVHAGVDVGFKISNTYSRSDVTVSQLEMAAVDKMQVTCSHKNSDFAGLSFEMIEHHPLYRAHAFNNSDLEYRRLRWLAENFLPVCR